MSGLTDKSYGEECELNKIKSIFVQINTEGIEEMLKIWGELYGPTSLSSDRFTKLIDDVKTFWECQIESQNERKKNLSKSIEKAGKDAVRLEKALELKPGVQNLNCGEDVPLVDLEEKIWKLLNSYQEISDKRLEEYSQLQKKEEELCAVLGLKPQIRDEFFASRKVGNSKRSDFYIPTTEKMSEYRELICSLERQNEQLKYDFETNKEKLQLLVKECKVPPNKIVERFFSSEKDDLPLTNKNLNLLISAINQYQTIKEELAVEAEHLRNEVASLSRKLFLDTNELESFLRENNGFNKTTIDNLKEKLKILKEERKKNLKDLIINCRKMLNGLWEKCCYSEEQKAFKPYQTNHWSEEVLNFHEMEIEKLQRFYEENKRIFELWKKYDELWTRMLHLEDMTSNKDRLFNNRGGCLLKEEKERKLIQKKVPTIKTELITLLNNYKDATEKDFLHFGMPLQSKIEQMEEQREISKENEKLKRKVTNDEQLFQESRLRLGGRQPFTGAKRRLLTPQHPSNYPKFIKTAHSTPRISRSASTIRGYTPLEGSWTRVFKENESNYDWLKDKRRETKIVRRLDCDTPCQSVNKFATNHSQCSLSYESFKENIAKSSSKQRNQHLQPSNRILRPRNENKTCSEKVSRYNTPIAKSLKSATVSKIPRPTTPIVQNTNAVTRTTNIRRKLPIIF